jgi:hypothetical protein
MNSIQQNNNMNSIQQNNNNMNSIQQNNNMNSIQQNNNNMNSIQQNNNMNSIQQNNNNMIDNMANDSESSNILSIISSEERNSVKIINLDLSGSELVEDNNNNNKNPKSDYLEEYSNENVSQNNTNDLSLNSIEKINDLSVNCMDNIVYPKYKENQLKSLKINELKEIAKNLKLSFVKNVNGNA